MITMKPTNSKPPYLLGLICLLPLFGASVGIGLLLSGLFRYKDKWLSIIGATGIVWSTVFYLFMMHPGSPIHKQLRIDLSQNTLDRLFREIEIYKLQHGQYPDSLQQLSSVQIFDPLQSPQTKFNYRRVGDRYILFGSGLDGIPNTEDDLFPRIILTDSSRIGLIMNPAEVGVYFVSTQ